LFQSQRLFQFWVDQVRFIGSAPDTMRTFGNPSPYTRPIAKCPTATGSPVSPLYAVSPIKECVSETDTGYLIHFGHESDEPRKLMLLSFLSHLIIFFFFRGS